MCIDKICIIQKGTLTDVAPKIIDLFKDIYNKRKIYTFNALKYGLNSVSKTTNGCELWNRRDKAKSLTAQRP